MEEQRHDHEAISWKQKPWHHQMPEVSLWPFRGTLAAVVSYEAPGKCANFRCLRYTPSQRKKKKLIVGPMVRKLWSLKDILRQFAVRHPCISISISPSVCNASGIWKCSSSFVLKWFNQFFSQSICSTIDLSEHFCYKIISRVHRLAFVIQVRFCRKKPRNMLLHRVLTTSQHRNSFFQAVLYLRLLPCCW